MLMLPHAADQTPAAGRPSEPLPPLRCRRSFLMISRRSFRYSSMTRWASSVREGLGFGASLRESFSSAELMGQRFAGELPVPELAMCFSTPTKARGLQGSAHRQMRASDKGPSRVDGADLDGSGVAPQTNVSTSRLKSRSCQMPNCRVRGANRGGVRSLGKIGNQHCSLPHIGYRFPGRERK